MKIDKFSKRMDLLGQLTALLNIELHIKEQRRMLEGELTIIEEEV